MEKRPLEGIKILDFSQVLSAPFCGMMLADMGADVIKIERPGNGDISREYGPYVNDISLYFCQYNRGKKGLAIDLRSSAGKNVIMDLAAEVDIVIENFKAGTLEKLGIGYDEMIKVNPELIYGSISGFGTHGPLSHLPCMDIIAAARSGLVSQSGVEGEAPIKPGFSMCDTWAGLHLLRGLTMALLNKQKTKKSIRIDIAMLDCAFYMCEEPILQHSLSGNYRKRTGNHDPVYAPSGEFVAEDGYVVIDVRNEKEWNSLCDALNISHLVSDSRFLNNTSRISNQHSLQIELEKATSVMGRYEIEKKLSLFEIPVSVVQTLAEFAKDPRTESLNVLAKIDQPQVGEYLAVNTPIRFSKTPVNPHTEAPSFPGAQSIDILKDIGYTQEKIEELVANNVIYQPTQRIG